MNPPEDELAPFGDAELEHEWRKQQEARDPGYRLLARLLREPPAAQLPPDFAAQVAARATRATRASAARLELVLLIGLMLALALVAAVVMVNFRDAWLVAFGASDRWLLTLGGCLVASWLLDRATQRGSTG